MFEYAMMLSREEATADEERRQRSAVSRSKRRDADDDDLQEVLEQIAVTESGADASRRPKHPSDSDTSRDEDFDEQQSVSRGSTSHMSSPAMRPVNSPPSRAWDILQSAGSSASYTRVGDSFSKVQSVHVPHSARRSTGNSRRPSMSSGLHAQGSQQSLPTLSSPSDWPSFDPSTSASGRSPSRLDLGPPAPALGSRHASFSSMAALNASNDGKAAGLTPSPSPSPTPARPSAWATGSPAPRLGRGDSETNSSHASPGIAAQAQDRSFAAAATRGRDEEDDLRFAIELSLAEEQSRKQTDPEN